MNTRQVNQQTANDVVRESLGLSADDLGMNAHEEAFTDDDLGSDLPDGGGADDGDGSDSYVQPEPRQEFSPEPEPQPDFLAPAPQPQEQQLPGRSEVRPDGKGNLVDKKTGAIVAKAGAEARMYQNLHRTREAHQALQAQHNEQTTRLNKAIEIGTQLFERLKQQQNDQGELAPEKFNLNRDEAREAMNFAKEAKVDPVGTIKKILTRAAANGIDLQSIGLAGGNFDPKSLMDLVRGEITQHMKPLQDRTAQETAQQQREREIQEDRDANTRELTEFLTKNPDARQHLQIFHQVYSQPQFQHMSLGEVWARLQLNLLRRGNPPQQQQRPANQQRRRQQQRLPNGQQRPPNRGQQNPQMAPVEMSYEDIIRGILPTN